VSAVAGAAASQPSNRHMANIGCFSRNFAFTGCVLLRRSIASGRRSWCLETISEQPGGTLHGADIAMMATRARTAALIHGRTIDIRTGVQCRAAHVDQLRRGKAAVVLQRPEQRVGIDKPTVAAVAASRATAGDDAVADRWGCRVAGDFGIEIDGA